MSEESSGENSSATPDTGGLAMDMAMEEARSDPSLREDVAAFLRDQRTLIDIQKHHLEAQFAPQLRQLRLGVWEKRLGVMLRVATGVVGLSVIAAFAVMVWNASRSSDLIMDAFSVPRGLVEKGHSGEVMAGDIAGRISDMLARFPNSARAPQSYANGSGSDIRIEIPQTGVSLSELDRFLRAKLGRDVHIAGAVVHTPTGLQLTVRAGALGSVSVEGPESELESLQQRLAEAVFGLTQPYRYGVYLANSNRWDEAEVVYRKLSRGEDIRERAWGYVGLGNAAPRTRDARDYNIRAMEQDPDNGLATSNLSAIESALGHAEQALGLSRKFLTMLASPEKTHIRAERIEFYQAATEADIASSLGAFREAAQKRAARDLPGRLSRSGQSAGLASELRRARDLAAARDIMAAPLEEAPGRAADGAFANERERMRIAMATEDWGAALKSLPVLQEMAKTIRSAKGPTITNPGIAFLLAQVGRFAEAEKLVADMPGDCNHCLIARALVAALQHQHARADFWFARAVADAPSIPFANYEWGRALLVRGKADDAIEQFKLSNQKGPKFADPLESWGEALMAKNQSHLALAKFEEANKYAPNWGRLHLKWGEALLYVGKKDEAQKQFAIASRLDLTPSEKSELARFSR